MGRGTRGRPKVRFLHGRALYFQDIGRPRQGFLCCSAKDRFSYNTCPPLDGGEYDGAGKPYPE
jgi:hypothetical protein